MSNAAGWLFAIMAALVVYHHIVYPVLLPLLARRFGKPHTQASLDDSQLPPVTLIIPAYREAKVLPRKLENTQQLDYPPSKLRAVLADDGSTDGTGELARLATRNNTMWRVHIRPINAGKIAVLNDEIAACQTEIVALSDASALLNSNALRIAAGHFSDPDVGVVCGTYKLDPAAPAGEQAYWRYQTAIKEAEGVLASPLGVHGAFYLFRRSLWQPLAADTINDDVILPMSIVLKGKRCVYDRSIVATEIELPPAEADFRRRIRIGAGNLQQALKLLPLAHPRHGWLSFIFLSGKFMRAMMPFFLGLMILIAGILALAGSTTYQLVFGATLLTAFAAAVLPSGNGLAYLIAGHAALGLGAVMYLTGFGHKAWQLSSLVNRSRP